jgi:hypothetical protein
MKQLFIVLTAVILTAGMFLPRQANAQAPQKISYQAVIRDAANNLVTNHAIGMKISILQGSATGTAVYTETQTPNTNANGLVSIEIGTGTGFDAINWAAGPFFIKTETDPAGGTSYSITGTSQLLSAPYALYAVKAANGINTTLVSTINASNITTTSAACGGTIFISTGEVTAYGVCWATTQNPTIANGKTTDGTGLGNFTSSITGLTAGKTYYVRAYATNSTGTTYGNQVTIQTPSSIVFPTVTTTDATNVTESAATCAGNVTATGGATVTERGVCWSTNQSPTISDSKIASGDGTGSFSIQLSGLAPNIIYYARAYAVNSAGVGYGTQVNFTTLKTLPVVATKDVTSISAMGGVTGGSISSSGGGTISDKGLCWGEGQNPTVNDNKISSGTGTAAFTSAIITAVPGTTYYVRAYATNELGTVYGPQKTFTALSNVTYYNFETGMKPAGWGGAWTVTNSISFDGSYCLKSLPGQSSQTTLTITLANAGQISFYYFMDWGTGCCGDTQTHLVFYIDNVNIYDFAASGGWNQGLFDVTAGTHTFTWQFNKATSYGDGGSGYIDYVVMPK